MTIYTTPWCGYCARAKAILVAATLDGVFRSRDLGQCWERISPTGHDDLRNFDSVAIDPSDPDLIYAGTYHLAWKTMDGGVRWIPMHRGMIDDSDVFSIVVDRTNPRRIYSSADLSSGSPVTFAATGRHGRRALKGVRFFGHGVRTSSIVMQNDPHLIRFIDTIHVRHTDDTLRIRF